MHVFLQSAIWSIARTLVRENKFSIFHVEETEDADHVQHSRTKAIHLILEQKRRALYMRLVPVDTYWAQVVERDVIESKRKFSQLAKRSRVKLDVVNLYVLPEAAPEDMVERALLASETPQHHPYQLQTAFLDLEHRTWQGQKSLLDHWGLNTLSLQHNLVPQDSLEDVSKVRMEIRQLEKEREKAMLSVFRYGKPVLTYTFLAINVLIYALVLINGGPSDLDTLLRFGAKSNGLIIEGEWWRFITPVFLHLGGWHFMFNMIALYFIGTAVERIFGSKRFLFIYLVAGISGSVASFAFTENLSAGASGAIFGCFGALIIFGQHYPKLFFRTMGRDILFFLGLNLALGFIIPNIDNYGHLGGLIGGYFAAAAVSLPLRKSRPLWRLAAAALLAVCLVMTISYGYADGKESAAYLSWRGQQFLKEDNVEAAQPIYEQLVKKEPEDPFHHFYLGYIYSKTGQLGLAEQSWKMALDLEPNMPEAHYNLAVIYVGNGQTELAKEHLLRAKELDPGNEHVDELLEQLE